MCCRISTTPRCGGQHHRIHDDAFAPAFFNNQEVLPRSRYSYDALDRLIEAAGRENSTFDNAPQRQENPALENVTFPVNAPDVLRNYTQNYHYDAVGNILRMRHRSGVGSLSERWTRNYAYATDNNRLLRTWTGTDETSAITYEYDDHGSMLNLERSPEEFRLTWDYRDMIHTINLGGGGRAFYDYDGEKQRTRKRIDNGGIIEDRFYLEGMEIYRRRQGSELVEEIQTHHLFADDQRVLIVEDVRRSGTADLPTGTALSLPIR